MSSTNMTIPTQSEQHPLWLAGDVQRENTTTTYGRVIHTLLLNTVRCDYFADDNTDEFQITREDGTAQGIFKVWAPTVIAQLETGIADADEAAINWAEGLRDKPLSFYESMEEWRAFASTMDRRLLMAFEKRTMPNDPEDAAVELLLRQEAAAALTSPFYHLEALVADSREQRTGNPIEFSVSGGNRGKLDVVAMMLPSAMSDQLDAERLNWHDISWEGLSLKIETMRQAKISGEDSVLANQFVILAKIAAIAKVDLETVLFAANALEFIPADVGGKSSDMTQVDAIASLHSVMEQDIQAATTSGVAKDVNALIRFLNWVPAIKSTENFIGKFWTYDSVCANANNMVGLVKEHAGVVFNADFAGVFAESLVPQLDGLDANSAKGRFIMGLLHEGKMTDAIVAKFNSAKETFIQEVYSSLEQIAALEKVLNIKDPLPTYLVGGKAQGLREAMHLFGPENVLGGYVVSAESTREWLYSLPNIGEKIDSMNSTSSIDEKLSLGKEIQAAIQLGTLDPGVIDDIRTKLGDKNIVVRSSSFDEDVQIIGAAPGIYESVVDINPNDLAAVEAAIKEVLGSFFSDKAISFREMKGLRHRPLFAVIVQEFIDGPGGTVFIENGVITINTAARPDDINNIGTSFETEQTGKHSTYLSADQQEALAAMARLSEEVNGASDIEFVIDPRTKQPLVLQLRMLDRPALSHNTVTTFEDLTSVSIDESDALPDVSAIEGNLNLVMSEGIDLEKFQGALFRWITANNGRIKQVQLSEAIPPTCHFANILETLGIKIDIL